VVRSALLLAETEPELRAYLGRNLSGDGFDVIEAARSGEALDLAEQQRPALIVADDPDLCRRLREGSPGRRWDRDVPVRTCCLHPSGVMAPLAPRTGFVVNVWGVVRPVAGGVGQWREVASLRRYRASHRMARRGRPGTSRDFLGTRRAWLPGVVTTPSR
jgi:hypothetical protein